MVTRWIAAVSLGLAAAVGVGAVAGAFSPGTFMLTAAVFAGCVLGPLTALGWLVFVAPRTVRTDRRAEDNAERAWFTAAGSAAFTDLLIVMGLGLAVTSVLGLELDAQLVMLALLLTAMSDVCLRYVRMERSAGTR